MIAVVTRGVALLWVAVVVVRVVLASMLMAKARCVVEAPFIWKMRVRAAMVTYWLHLLAPHRSSQAELVALLHQHTLAA